MANFNKVFLIGNLTRDPELRYTPSGTAVVNLGMAVNRRFKDREGQQKSDVCFLTIVVWDKQAEACNQYLQKGRPLFVEGRLQSRSWEAKDGTKRHVLEIRAERVQFLGQLSRETASSGEAVAAPMKKDDTNKTDSVQTDYGLDSSWSVDEAAS